MYNKLDFKAHFPNVCLIKLESLLNLLDIHCFSNYLNDKFSNLYLNFTSFFLARKIACTCQLRGLTFCDMLDHLIQYNLKLLCNIQTTRKSDIQTSINFKLKRTDIAKVILIFNIIFSIKNIKTNQ